MTRITTLAKRLLDKDIKTLIDGKLLNSDLSVTDRGRAALDAIAVQRDMAELVKIAEERIEEDKRNCSKDN